MDVHVCFINKINATTFVKLSDLFRSYTELCKSIKIILEPLWGPKIILDKSPYSMQYLAVFASAAIFPVFFCIVIYRFIIEIMRLVLPYLASELLRSEAKRFKTELISTDNQNCSWVYYFKSVINGYIRLFLNITDPLRILLS